MTQQCITDCRQGTNINIDMLAIQIVQIQVLGTTLYTCTVFAGMSIRQTRVKHFANVVQHPTRHIIGHCENENSRGRKVAVDWQTAQCLISDLTKT